MTFIRSPGGRVTLSLLYWVTRCLLLDGIVLKKLNFKNLILRNKSPFLLMNITLDHRTSVQSFMLSSIRGNLPQPLDVCRLYCEIFLLCYSWTSFVTNPSTASIANFHTKFSHSISVTWKPKLINHSSFRWVNHHFSQPPIYSVRS